MDRGLLPPLVRGEQSAVPNLYNRNQRRLLVLPQSGREPAPAPAQELPGVVGADAEMGQGQPGYIPR